MTIEKKPLQLFLILVSVFIIHGNQTQAASVIYPKKVFSNQLNIPPGNFMRGDVFVNLSVKEFSMRTSQKLNMLQKIFFKASQKKIRKDLKSNPDLLIIDYFDPVKQKFKLDSLWFILGIMIGPLAVLFSFTSKQNKMSRKSAFLGLLVFIVWFGFLFII